MERLDDVLRHETDPQLALSYRRGSTETTAKLAGMLNFETSHLVTAR
jgi:hypothetical protein